MKTFGVILAVLLLLAGANSLFMVREGQDAILLQFGRIVSDDIGPGLHLKLPFVQQVQKFDNRILQLDAQPEDYFTSEKKSVKVDFYVEWRIANTASYYRATGGLELNATQRLSPIVKDALRFQFNARPLDELIAGGRFDITQQVMKQADEATRKSLGIEVVDVRIKRIDLPDEVSDSVYNRMRAERLNLANELRSTGNEAGERIRADADRQREVLLAEANGDATRVRGEGDAEAAKIYADAYNEDPKFFAFYRSLGAYRTAFGDSGTVLVLKPDSPFLDYFDDGKGE